MGIVVFMTQSPYTVTWEILEDLGKVILDKGRRPRHLSRYSSHVATG